VGSAPRRAEVLSAFRSVYPGCSSADASSGWEEVTLRMVRDYARAHDGAVLYAHTKGASHANDACAEWREFMTKRVVSGWRRCVEALERGYDAVGCHWMELPDFPTFPPHFSGNFWMASCAYLRTLPPLPESPADGAPAYRWFGQRHPRVLDLGALPTSAQNGFGVLDLEALPSSIPRSPRRRAMEAARALEDVGLGGVIQAAARLRW
jgi:hypothetical protein